MKTTIHLIFLSICILATQKIIAQPNTVKKLQLEIKQAMKNDGYRLVEEDGMAKSNHASVVGIGPYTFDKKKHYAFFGIVDKCYNCPVSIKFAQPSQTPADLPDEKNATIFRKKKLGATVIANKFRLANNLRGYYILFNKSTSYRYSHAMLFMKD